MSKQLLGKEAIGNVIIPPPETLIAWQTDAYPHGITRTWMPAYCIPLLVFSTILLAIRLTLRLRQRGGGFGLDDALLLPSWMLLVAFTGVVCWSSENGTLSRHMWDVNPLDYQTVALSAWLGQFIFLIGTCLVRISVLLFYRRMVKGTFKRRWKWSVWVAIGFTVAWTLAFCIMLLASCTPVEATWKVFDPTYTEDWKCADTRPSNTAAGVLAVVSDCYSLFLPWSMIWPLDMPKRQKFALNIIFSFGIIVIVAAGFRTAHSMKLGTDTDSTWVGFWVYFWTALEWNLAIICNCLPSLRAFFRAYLKDTVDKALNSLSSRSKYKETNKSTLASQHNIELQHTITIETEKPYHHRRPSTKAKEADSDTESTERLDPMPPIPKAHARDSQQTFLDMQESPPEFADSHAPWDRSRSNVDIIVTGPEEARRPYGQV